MKATTAVETGYFNLAPTTYQADVQYVSPDKWINVYAPLLKHLNM